MPNLSGRLASIIVAACLLTGCQPPTPPPSPLPSYRCTPEAGGAEFDCSPKQYDDMVAKEKLYAEAEAVYRKFLAEDIRIMRAGGVDAPTSVLLETTSGAFLDDVMSEYTDMRSIGLHAEGSDPVLVALVRQPGLSKGGSTVVLASCIDSTATAFVSRGKVQKHGPVARDTVYFAPAESSLRIIGADGGKVTSCGS